MTLVKFTTNMHSSRIICKSNLTTLSTKCIHLLPYKRLLGHEQVRILQVRLNLKNYHLKPNFEVHVDFLNSKIPLHRKILISCSFSSQPVLPAPSWMNFTFVLQLLLLATSNFFLIAYLIFGRSTLKGSSVPS